MHPGITHFKATGIGAGAAVSGGFSPLAWVDQNPAKGEGAAPAPEDAAVAGGVGERHPASTVRLTSGVF